MGYRPSSLILLVGKNIVQMLKERIVKSMELNGIWNKMQQGSTKSILCQNKLSSFFGKITDIFIKKENSVCISYMGFNKAFDTVPD